MNLVGSIIPAKWKSVGRQLRIREGQLEGIDEENRGKLQECFSAVFITWRRLLSSPYTWSTIIRVLKSREVNELKLASGIEEWLKEQMTSTIHKYAASRTTCKHSIVLICTLTNSNHALYHIYRDLK